MKKVLFICTLILLSVIVNAQERHSNSTYHFETTKVFSVKMIQDKFDDVLSSEEIKTLVTITDSTVIIEEKEKEIKRYLRFDEIFTTGNKDNIVNLVADVYGYEYTFLCVNQGDTFIATYRVVTRSRYDNETQFIVFILQNQKTKERITYIHQYF